MKPTTWERSAKASHRRRCRPPLSRCLRWRRWPTAPVQPHCSPGAASARHAAESRSPRGPARRSKNGESSNPLQCALLVCPDVPDNQDGQEYGHLRHSKPTQGPVPDRPREQEDGFYVENDEQDGDDVKPHRVAAARVRSRLDAALIRLQFGAGRSRRTYQLGGHNQHHGKENSHGKKDEERNITARHGTNITCL